MMMKPKNLFVTVCVLCALCVAGCEKHEQKQIIVDNTSGVGKCALLGKWTWRSQVIGCSPETITIETPETTGEKHELLFDTLKWHYFVNDCLTEEDTYFCSEVDRPDTLCWNRGMVAFDVSVKWYASDSIALDLIEGGGCQGPSVWVKIK